MKKRTITLYLPVIIAGMLLAGCEDADVTKAEKDEITAKEQVARRMEDLGLSPDAEPGLHLREEPSAEAAEFWAKLKEQRKAEGIHQKSKELPEEIVQVHEQLLEDLKEFYGVDELPETEIAPGVKILVPPTHLKGEKYEKLNNFLSERYQKLMKLYEKHGLRGPQGSAYPKSKSVLGVTPEIQQALGYGGSFVTAYRPGPSAAVGNYYSYTEAYSFVEYLDVISDYYAGGFYLGQAVDRAYNSTFVELSLGPVDVQESYTCYDISSDHYLYEGSISDNFFSSDFDCV